MPLRMPAAPLAWPSQTLPGWRRPWMKLTLSLRRFSEANAGPSSMVAPLPRDPYGKNIQPCSKTSGERVFGLLVSENLGRMASVQIGYLAANSDAHSFPAQRINRSEEHTSELQSLR